MKPAHRLASLGLLATLAACTPFTQVQNDSQSGPLIEGNWTAVMNGKAKLEKIERNPVIVFDSQNHKVSGFDGCNNFNGSYSFEGKLIKGRLLSTQMACPSDEARAVSSTLHRLFDQGAEVITIHFLSAKGLVLLNKEIDAELVLEPTEKFNKINKK